MLLEECGTAWDGHTEITLLANPKNCMVETFFLATNTRYDQGVPAFSLWNKIPKNCVGQAQKMTKRHMYINQ